MVTLTLVQAKAALALLRFMFALLLPRGEKDVLYRWDLAQAIVLGTDVVEERYTLARLARFESGFRRNVARCEILGDHGKSHGAFQVQPQDTEDRRDVCADLPAQVRVAVKYLHRSADACPTNRDAAKLHPYVSGLCVLGPEAHAVAALRWGGQDLDTDGNPREDFEPSLE